MAHISSFSEREIAMNLSSRQCRKFADADWIVDGSHVDFNTQLWQDRARTRYQSMSELDVDTQQMMVKDICNPFVNSGWNIKSNGVKVYSQSRNPFYIHNFEMDRDPTSYKLPRTSSAVRRSNDHFASITLLDHLEGGDSRDQTELQRTSARDAGEVGSLWSPFYNYISNEDFPVTPSTNNKKSCDGIWWSDKGNQGVHEERSSNATYLASGYDERSLFHTKTGGLLPSNRHFSRDPTKNKHYAGIGTSANQVDFTTMECTERKCSEGDYLFAENLEKKNKFCLLVDRKTETQMRAEFYPYNLRLSDIIRRKYRSLGIHAQVEACQYQSQDKINVKAFNIMFENCEELSKASRLVDDGKLFFSLREARPSLSNYVKFEVLNSVGVFKSEYFRQKWIHILQKGDIVIADQVKGKKIRIIKWCPAGGKIDFDLSGWVLLKTWDIRLLRRIDHRGENKVNEKSRSRSGVMSPLLLMQKIIGQHCMTGKKEVRHKSNPHRVSASHFSPFRVLVELVVRKGRREPTVIGRLKPGAIVWANQHKGSMLRIMKMDRCGNIVVDVSLKPKIWGWVCLQRKGDLEPRLERIPYEVTKYGRFMNSQCGRNTLRCEDHYCSNNQFKQRAKKCRKDRKIRITKFAEERSCFQGKKHFNNRVFNDWEDCVSSSLHSDQAKCMTNHGENKVLVSSSLNELAIRTIAGDERQKDNYAISGIVNTVESKTSNRETMNKMWGASEQVEPYLLPTISETMNSSSSECSMSTSSISPRPKL